MKALLIDHDDSFTCNLRQWLSPLGDIEVLNHRELNPNTKADLIVLSPGPKAPGDYPHMLEFIQQLPKSTAVFGVCLGLQMLVRVEGGEIRPYQPPLHGKKSKLLAPPPYDYLNNLEVARYHSLYCANYDPALWSTRAHAANDDKPMWLCHRSKKWMGVQFHPESFLTEKADLHFRSFNEWLYL